jgi:hypothetical protein
VLGLDILQQAIFVMCWNMDARVMSCNNYVFIEIDRFQTGSRTGCVTYATFQGFARKHVHYFKSSV